MYEPDTNALITKPTLAMLSELFPIGRYHLSEEYDKEILPIVSAIRTLRAVMFRRPVGHEDHVQFMRQVAENARGDYGKIFKAYAEKFPSDRSKDFSTFVQSVVLHIVEANNSSLVQILGLASHTNNVEEAIHTLVLLAQGVVSRNMIQRNPFIRFIPEAAVKWSLQYPDTKPYVINITGYHDWVLA